MKLSLERKIILGLSFALLVLLLAGASAWWNAARIATTFRWVDRTHEVLFDLEATLTEALNIQASGRGFVLTGDEQFLGPYNTGRERVASSVRALRVLTADNPGRQQQLDGLIPLLARLEELLDERIAVRRRDGLAASASAAEFLASKQTMGDVRRAIAAMETEERALLRTRSADAQAASRTTIGIVGLGGTVALLLGMSAILVVRRDFHLRRDAEAAMVELNTGLDRRVRERTAQLETANVAMTREIAERKRVEAAIQHLNEDLELHVAERTAALESTNRELEAFSYSVSHDLRAPLRHIDGFASLLARHADTKLDPQSHRYISTISAAAKQMGRLIDDLLTFSRMSRAPMSLTNVDQNSLVATVIRDGAHDQNHPALTWDVAPLPAVHADAAMLRQVWVNLIENAVKYSSKSPQPRIAIGPVAATEISAEQVFFVRDNGVGFDMTYAGKLFGVFQRLHSPADFEGTGIGLANVRRIVTRHGGRTWAEGRVGEGAVFYFSLPVKPSDL